MKRRHLLASVCAAIALASGPALAQDKVTLKFGWTSSNGEKDPYGVGARIFKAKVEEYTKGSIEVQLYPNRAIGDERQMIEGMRFGTVDAGIITNAVIAQIEPAFQVNDMPFLYADEAKAHKVLDGKVGAELANRLAKKGVISLGWMEGGFRNMINNSKPVAAPDDVKGVKYRVMQNPVYIDMFSSLGGAAVPMAWGETFTAVQQGAVDGLEIPVAIVEANKYYEITKYLSMTNHTYSMIGLLISKRSMDKLSAQRRDAVIRAGKEATVEQRAIAGKNAKEVVEALQARGMKVNQVSDPAAFRSAVAPVHEKFRKSGSGDLLDQVLAEVK